MARWYPLIGADPDAATRAGYADRAGRVLDRVETIVRAVHSRGYVIGDIHPANIMIDDEDDDRVALIDLEAAGPVADAVRRTNGRRRFRQCGGHRIRHRPAGPGRAGPFGSTCR